MSLSIKQKDRLLLLAIGIFIIGFIVVGVLTKEKEVLPMSAEHMTVEERTTHDQQILQDKIKGQYDVVKEVRVNHESNNISVLTLIENGKQYAEEDAEQIEESLKQILEESIGELTFEKEYSIIVWSKDSNILN